MNIQFNETQPIFLQIVQHVKAEIGKGALKPDDKLPSIRELSKLIQVNPNTIGRAYQELERAGITVTKRGLGVFINQTNDQDNIKDEMARGYVQTFIENMASLGFSVVDTLAFLARVQDE